MGSRTKNWNRKPGDPQFDRGYNSSERKHMRSEHARKKRRQRAVRKYLGV